MEHHLKTWPPFFSGVRDGSKPFEVRKNDRGYKVGHVLVLEEYDPSTEKYTGEVERRVVTYMLDDTFFGICEGYCVLGLQKEF